jgi:hypothetical protein
MITYSVEIVGHEAPFKWIVRKQDSNSRNVSERSRPVSTGKVGSADTRAAALEDARESARALEYGRKHRATVMEETLFTVETQEDITFDVPDSPDEWLTTTEEPSD